MKKLNLPDVEIAELYLSGSSTDELAKIYNCSSATIVKRLCRTAYLWKYVTCKKCLKGNPRR
jgi:hypothetical protein